MNREYSIECVKIIEAWLDGRKIEFRMLNDDVWSPVATPQWNFHKCEYRIKPDPVGPKELWAVITSNETDCNREWAEQRAKMWGGTAVRYVRADD